MTGLFIAELDELRLLLGDEIGLRVARVPGGWRSLSPAELGALNLPADKEQALGALQRLAVRRERPRLPVGALANPSAVAEVYGEWLGAMASEVVIALALDGMNHLLEEIEVARGGAHGAALTPGDVFRPLIRAGASAIVLAHNHPSGDPTPSREDVHMTRAVATVGELIGIPLLDHLVFARGGGWSSMFELGLIEETRSNHEHDHLAGAVCGLAHP